MGEVPGDVSTIDGAPRNIEVLDDGRTQQCHQFRVDLLTLKMKATSVWEAILQQNELEGMRVVCAESTTKLAHIGERLDSLMV